MSEALKSRPMKKLLITGATGFLGRRMAEIARTRVDRVDGLVRDPSKARFLLKSGIDLVSGDVTDLKSLKIAVDGMDTVIHAAAKLGPATATIEDYREVNAKGTANLIQACRESGCVERFVYVSSVGVLGPLKDREVACEGTPPRPVDKYEITKLEGEEITLSEASNGFPAVVARPAWIYGPGDKRTLKLFRMIAKGRFFIVGGARNKQHPVWVDDVAHGLLACATAPGIEGRVYHLGGPEILRVENMCKMIAEACDAKIPSFRPPLWMARLLGRALEDIFAIWGGEPPVDSRKVDFFRVNRAYSIKRAREELNWEPEMRFKDGIRQAVRWYRDHEKL